MARMKDTVFASAARTTTANSSPFRCAAAGARFFLEITAASGSSPTLDLKAQVYDEVGENYHDLTGAGFAQKTGTGNDYLVIRPGIGETSNEAVSDVMTGIYRVVAAIGGSSPSFTFTLHAEYQN